MKKGSDTRKKLGTILLERSLLSQEELQEALLHQQNTGSRLGQILLERGVVQPGDMLDALASHYGIDARHTLTFSLEKTELLQAIPVHFLKKHRMVPFAREGSVILVALADPLKIQPVDDLTLLLHGESLQPVLASEAEIERIITSHFEKVDSEVTSDLIEDLEEADLEILSSPVAETEDILDMANEAPIIRLVNTIVKQAVQDRASDIHIEPYEKELAVRFRVDGILYRMFTPPKKYQSAIISRVKIMANLNIAENRLPQDGRIQLKIGGKDIDIRVSVFPTYYGERVVLRLLNKSDMTFDLESLGFSSSTLSRFDELIKKTHGIILVTGPTGSGKSTTLYSVLTRLNREDVNILTVEDPIEYQIPGIGQMQVKPKIELTFASGLRSILRQDPDIVMVGEIRDRETAEIAVQSALTGHRVFSTLHTNDAASGVTRLIDMKVEPFLIASSVNAFLAQRLVRTLCPHCREPYKPAARELKEVGLTVSKLKNGTLYRPKGCDKCLNSGYRGRTGIYEFLPVTQSLRGLIMKRADSEEIKNMARSEGMVTLLEDGLQKVVDGVTSLDEVMRVS